MVVQNCWLLEGLSKGQYQSQSLDVYESEYMRLIFALFAIVIISMDALAEVGLEDVVKAVPSAIGEPEPLLPERCEFLGVQDGVKLWRGDCVSAPPYAQLIAPTKKKRQKSRRQ